ncbi:MAG: single-stranded DNA-binding protein [Cupriavidus necator]
MIDGLIAGKIHGEVKTRTGSNGRPFTTCAVRAATSNGESMFVNAIAFSDTARRALESLAAGDSVSLAGELTPKVWRDKHGEAKPALDMTVHGVLTSYHVMRKRKAVAGRVEAESDDLSDPL